jgi:hypothetical protein
MVLKYPRHRPNLLFPLFPAREVCYALQWYHGPFYSDFETLLRTSPRTCQDRPLPSITQTEWAYETSPNQEFYFLICLFQKLILLFQLS